MNFPSTHTTARLVVLALALTIMLTVSPVGAQGRPAAYLATNTSHGMQLYAIDASGTVATVPVQFDDHLLYSTESWSVTTNQTHVEHPEDFNPEEPRYAFLLRASLSPDADRLAFVRFAYIEPDMGFVPGELVITNLTTGATRTYPKPDPSISAPVWSLDGGAVLFGQTSPVTNTTRVEIVDTIEGDYRTAISDLAVRSLRPIWMTPGRFLLLSWPNVFIGGRSIRGTYLFVTLTDTLVGVEPDIAPQLDYGYSVWSSREERLYVSVGIADQFGSTPPGFHMLYTLDLDGRFQRVLDLQASYPDGMAHGSGLVANVQDGRMYIVTSDVVGTMLRVDRIDNGAVVPVASHDIDIPEFVIADYALSPDGRHIAVTGYADGSAQSAGVLFVVELATGRVVVEDTAETGLCTVSWVSATALVTLPTSGWDCAVTTSNVINWRDIVSGDEKTISLADNRPFWLLTPQGN